MGETRAIMKISNPLIPDQPPIEVDGCVDTGAVMILLGADIVDKLGVHAFEKAVVTLADDSKCEMKRRGPVKIQIGDRFTHLDVLVGPVGCEPLIGQMVMESLDLLVDPQRQELKPRPSSPAYPSYKMK